MISFIVHKQPREGRTVSSLILQMRNLRLKGDVQLSQATQLSRARIRPGGRGSGPPTASQMGRTHLHVGTTSSTLITV